MCSHKGGKRQNILLGVPRWPRFRSKYLDIVKLSVTNKHVSLLHPITEVKVFHTLSILALLQRQTKGYAIW